MTIYIADLRAAAAKVFGTSEVVIKTRTGVVHIYWTHNKQPELATFDLGTPARSKRAAKLFLEAAQQYEI